MGNINGKEELNVHQKIDETLRNKVNAIMKSSNISVYELGDKVGVGGYYLNKVLDKKINMGCSLHLIRRLEQFVGI